MNASTKVQRRKVIDNPDNMTGIQKVAVLMIALGIGPASNVFRQLTDSEIEKVTVEIANMQNISPRVVDEVLQEFHDLMLAKQYVMEGGLDYARDILKSSRGDKAARDLIRRIEAATEMSAFALFQTADTSQMVQFLQSEHPQTAALILGNLKVDRSAEVLSNLTEDIRGEVIYRLATMGKVAPEVIKEIEHVIREQMGGYDSDSGLSSGGANIVANILNAATISTERMVLEEIETRDPELAEEIKSLMFLFEDILALEDRVVQRVISEVDKQDLVVALKGADQSLVEKFTSNMSNRARNILLEDMDALGPMRLKEVEDAQQRIIQRIKQLEETGQIAIRKTTEEQFVE
jgi:flagellar motor switch protein FliG